MSKPSLATSPEYRAHAIAALKVFTRAEPLEYMDKFPYPQQSTPTSTAATRPVQLDLFGGSQ
jgi:hypothetical protein